MQPGDQYVCSFGEILWDLLPSGKQLGGAPMNVVFHLQQLGIPSVMISRVGNDDLGNEIKRALAEKTFPLQWIQTDNKQATGTVNVTLDAQHQATYEIVYPVAWDFISLTDEMISLIENTRAIIFGSLACRNSISRATLFSLLEKAPLKIFDVNLRAPHYSKELIESLLHAADMVKMNDDELRIITSWYGLNNENETERIEYLKNSFQLQMIIVTKGSEGAVIQNDEGFFQSKGYKVKVSDTVGSGDAFLAALLKNYFEEKPMQQALDYAGALGALVATHRGANPIISQNEILQIMQQQK